MAKPIELLDTATGNVVKCTSQQAAAIYTEQRGFISVVDGPTPPRANRKRADKTEPNKDANGENTEGEPEPTTNNKLEN